MSDYTVTINNDNTEREVLPKGSYKLVITKVAFSPISDWPDWKQQQAIDNHNEREEKRVEERAKEGKTYEPKMADSINDLSFTEKAQYVFFFRVKGGKHDGKTTRPYYTGIHLNPKKEYREKANLYKVLDAALPDVEAVIATGSLDVQEAVGYPLMAQIGLTEKGNNKYVAFMQSDDHGKKDVEVALGVTDVQYPDADDAEIPF